jgi:hypothetical protein
MDFWAASGDVRGMTLGNKLDRSELRHQPRYMAPVFDIVVECELFHSRDVSAGGVHLDGVCEGVPVGAAVDGWIVIPGISRAVAFSGEIIRTDPATGNSVVRFDDIDDDAREFLGRVVAWRLH